MVDCPTWNDEDTKHSPACYAEMQPVLVRALTKSLRQTPNRGAIRAWHRTAFGAVVPVLYYAGNFRQADARRVCLERDVAVDGVPGTPFREVLAHVLELDGWLLSEMSALDVAWPSLQPDERIHRLASTVGVAVARFVHIHPFLNGNGRMSRLLWRVLLFRMGFRKPGFSVMRRPGGSYPEAMRLAMRGQYGPAVAMVLRGLARGPLPTASLPVATSRTTATAGGSAGLP